MPVPASVIAATAGGTLYKFEGSGTFITRTGTVNFVRGPIPNDATERTYYTGDGVPKVTTLAGDVRQLGVPQPGAAPSVVVNSVAQFSEDDAATAFAARQSQFATILWANINRPVFGVADADLTGFSAGGDAYSFLYLIPGVLASRKFTATNAYQQVLVDDQFGFNAPNYSDGGVNGYVPLALRAPGAAVGTGFAAALTAITNPDDASQLLSAEAIAAAVEAAENIFASADAARSDSIERITDLKTEFVAIANSGTLGALANIPRVEAFYARSQVTGEIDAAVDAAVSEIYSAMFSFND
jgi:hypothetical protein